MSSSSDPSSIAAQACAGQPLQQFPFSTLQDKAATLFSNLGLNKCKTKDVTVTESFDLGDLVSSALGDVKAAAEGGITEGSFGLIKFNNGSGGTTTVAPKTATDTKTTVDCGAVNVLAQAYNNAVQNISCLIVQDTTNTTTSITEENTFTVNVGGSLTMDCPLVQTVSGNIEIITYISANCSLNIQQAMQNHIQNFVSTLKNMYKGTPEYSSQGQGTQSANSILSSQTQNNVNSKINETIDTINTSATIGNVVNLNVKDSLTMNAAQGMCGSLTQTIAVNIYASSIVSSAFTEALKDINLGSLMPALSPPPQKSNLLIGAIIIIVILILLGLGFYYFIYKKKVQPAANGAKTIGKAGFKYPRRMKF